MENFEITEWFVRQYTQVVYHFSQQKSVRLAGKARQESQAAKMKSFDRIHGTEVRKKVARHEDTPHMSMEHSRRNVILSDFDWATLIDDFDQMRMLNSPTSPYIIEAKNAFNRKKDDVFIEAFSGTALAGEDGTAAVTFPDFTEDAKGNNVPARIAASNGTTFSALNVKTLRAIKKRFRKLEVISEDGEDAIINMACSADELDQLLAEAEVGSADYNNIKALINGEVDYFMGIKFIHTERLNLETTVRKFNVTTGLPDAGGSSVAGYRRCLAWVNTGMIVSTGKNVSARIKERADKCDALEPYIKMSCGAVRMDENKCMEIYIDPTA